MLKISEQEMTRPLDLLMVHPYYLPVKRIEGSHLQIAGDRQR